MHTPLAALVWALQRFRVRKAFKFGGGSNANAGQPARTAAPQVPPVAAAPRALTQAKEVLPRSLDMTRMGPGNPPFQDLQVRSLLGLGTFGSVHLVVDRNTRVGYALKAWNKPSSSEWWSANLLRERRLLAMVQGHHPFVVGCVEAYQDELRAYVLQPLVTGGEFSKLLLKQQPLPLAATRFYVGCVVLALEFLHSMHIVYRDLKPENLMLDEHGYVRIIDLGTAKRLDPAAGPPVTRTLCGTPE